MGWALLRPSMAWLSLPDKLKERAGEVDDSSLSPCLLANFPPHRPSVVEEEGFIVVEEPVTAWCLEGASMGWHTLPHRRPGICIREHLPTDAELVDGGSQTAGEALGNPECESLDSSADELEGIIRINGGKGNVGEGSDRRG